MEELICVFLNFEFCSNFVFIYLPHDHNNYKEMPKKIVGRNGEEA